MPMAPSSDLSERLPTDEEATKARQATQYLAQMTDEHGALSMRVHGDGDQVIDLPPAVSEMVLELLMLIGRREAVTLVPFGAELTTQQAADILNISRPFLVKLIKHQEIECHMVGTHRRIYAKDVLAYKQRRDDDREASLKKLAQFGQEIDAV